MREIHIVKISMQLQSSHAKTQRHEFLVPWETNVTHLIGFLSSTDGYIAYTEKYPDNTLLEDLKKAYLDAKGEPRKPQGGVCFCRICHNKAKQLTAMLSLVSMILI